MSDSFINKLTESVRLNKEDYCIFDIYDNILSVYNSEKISFDTLTGNLSSILFPIINSRFVHLSGDTLTGYLKLYADPVARMDAATKGFVDDGLSSLSAAVDVDFANFKTYVDGLIAGLGQASNNFANYVNSNYVNVSGDTMTGYLTLHREPSATMHAANKGYIDTGLSALSASLNSKTDTNYVHVSGDTMEGDLNFNGNKITKFLVDVKTVTSNFTIDATYNGSVILVNSPTQITANITQNTLPTGFNAVLIQMNDGGVKIGTTGTVSVVNVNNALLTRKKYAQMNFCVLSANCVWISGDII
jgi:uncharacterized protein involved in tellurium resistance